MYAHAIVHSQRTAYRSWSSASTIWALGLQLQTSGSTPSTFSLLSYLAGPNSFYYLHVTKNLSPKAKKVKASLFL